MPWYHLSERWKELQIRAALTNLHVSPPLYLMLSVRWAVSGPRRSKLLSSWWQGKWHPPLPWSWCGQPSGEQRVSFSFLTPFPPPLCACCLSPTAIWAWILSPVSRLEIVDSDLVVKLEPRPVDGPVLQKLVVLKAKWKIKCQPGACLSLSQTS